MLKFYIIIVNLIEKYKNNSTLKLLQGMGGKKTREFVWSAMSSRQGSTAVDLDKTGKIIIVYSLSATSKF